MLAKKYLKIAKNYVDTVRCRGYSVDMSSAVPDFKKKEVSRC